MLFFSQTHLPSSLLIPSCPPVSPYRPPEVTMYDDVDPGYDPQGYTVLVVLHNSVRRIMHRRYSPLLCSRGNCRPAYVQIFTRLFSSPPPLFIILYSRGSQRFSSHAPPVYVYKAKLPTEKLKTTEKNQFVHFSSIT